MLKIECLTEGRQQIKDGDLGLKVMSNGYSLILVIRLIESDLFTEQNNVITSLLIDGTMEGTPTFSSHLGESIIDITLSNSPPVISGWKVSRVPSLSDHRIVEFRANHVKPGPEPLIRNMKKVSWQAVAEDLRSAVPPCLPTWWSVQDLEAKCKDFTNSLRNSIDRQAPLQKPGKRHTVWWNPQCTEARKL